MKYNNWPVIEQAINRWSHRDCTWQIAIRMHLKVYNPKGRESARCNAVESKVKNLFFERSSRVSTTMIVMIPSIKGSKISLRHIYIDPTYNFQNFHRYFSPFLSSHSKCKIRRVLVMSFVLTTTILSTLFPWSHAGFFYRTEALWRESPGSPSWTDKRRQRLATMLDRLYIPPSISRYVSPL